ncbi:MAG TPA: aminotransferase class IV family protein [Rhodanobacteraceae bacterium]|nr:aminotransferase class IV family protein [Rhodanobacteraceae bacterium]
MTHSAFDALDRCELNGKTASAADLRALATTNYGHFTAMQVEAGRVRGLDLHLARLDASTRELFGQPLDATTVRAHLRSAFGDFGGDASLRINVFSRALHRDRMAEPAAPDVVVSVTAPRRIETTPVRLKAFRYERVLPHVKHVGTFGLFHHRRLAQLDGFDDALFVDAGGAVSEASIWNIGFFDGSGVVWPDAPALRGISMQLLQKGLRERGTASDSHRVAHIDVGAFRSAFLTNCSCAVRPVAEIDGVRFAVDPALTAMLEACYASNAPQAI